MIAPRSNTVSSPTAITATSSSTPEIATAVSSRGLPIPVKPTIPIPATSAITSPEAMISLPASANPDQIGVR